MNRNLPSPGWREPVEGVDDFSGHRSSARVPCVVDNHQACVAPDLRELPCSSEQGAQIETAVDEHTRDACQTIRVAEQLALLQLRAV